MSWVNFLWCVAGAWVVLTWLYDVLIGNPAKVRERAQQREFDIRIQRVQEEKERQKQDSKKKILDQIAWGHFVHGDPQAVITCSNGHRYECRDFFYGKAYTETTYHTVRQEAVKEELYETRDSNYSTYQVKVGERVTPPRDVKQAYVSSGSTLHFGCPQCHSRLYTFDEPDFRKFRLCERRSCCWWYRPEYVSPTLEPHHGLEAFAICTACGFCEVDMTNDAWTEVVKATPQIKPGISPQAAPPPRSTGTIIIQCQKCGQKNRVPTARISQAICARCKQPY